MRMSQNTPARARFPPCPGWIVFATALPGHTPLQHRFVWLGWLAAMLLHLSALLFRLLRFANSTLLVQGPGFRSAFSSCSSSPPSQGRHEDSASHSSWKARRVRCQVGNPFTSHKLRIQASLSPIITSLIIFSGKQVRIETKVLADASHGPPRSLPRFQGTSADVASESSRSEESSAEVGPARLMIFLDGLQAAIKSDRRFRKRTRKSKMGGGTKCSWEMMSTKASHGLSIFPG